jgi:hypothetical protein
LGGLWRSPDFRRLWTSLTITSFGAQITNLALPLTAALLLQLPIVIATDLARGAALRAIPLAAWYDVLTIELLYGVGFFCGVQNVVGGAAYQVLLAQLAGRRRLVEANAKVTLGETSAALVGPGLAGLLIQALTAPFAILLDGLSFFASALMLRGVKARSDVVHAGPRPSVWAEIHEGLLLVWNSRTLFALAAMAAAWQLLHHMQIAVLILFATRELHLSAGAIGIAYMFGGLGCVVAAASAERLSQRFGVGSIIVYGLGLTAFAWQAFGLITGPVWAATLAMGATMFVFDFGAVLYGINYLALRQAITPDRLMGRMTATMRFCAVAAAPLGSLLGGALATGVGLRPTLWIVGAGGLGLALGAMTWSPVRTHRTLPGAAGD